MGVDIGLEGLPRRRGLFRRRVLKPTALEEIIALGRAFAERLGPVFASHYRSFLRADELSLEFLPLENRASFQREPDRLCFSARTSNLGPGYHAAIVEFVKSLENPLDIEWRESDPDDENGEYFDETEYFASLDRDMLDQAMTAHFCGISNMVLEREPTDPPSPFFLSMGGEFRPNSTATAASPLGEWDRSFFEGILGAEGSDLTRLSSRFFPWWNHPLDGEDYRKIGTALAWSKVRWISPEDEVEEAKLRGVLDCFRKAQRAGASDAVSDSVMVEIASLLEGDPVTTQAPVGIGYLRGTIERTIMGGWSIRVPGTFLLIDDEDPTLHVLQGPGLQILSRTATFKDPTELVSFDMPRDEDQHVHEMVLDHDDLECRWSLKTAENGSVHVFVVTRLPGQFCRQTYSMADRGEIERALSIAKTIAYQG